MPAPHTRIATVTAATRAGNTASQDRLLVLPAAVAVLDGASAPDQGERDGGWYADQLSAALTERLVQRGADLAGCLEDAIRETAALHGLSPGGPSSTVAVVRWDDEAVDALVLGDSTVVALSSGSEEMIEDRRLRCVAPVERDNYRDNLANGGGYGEEHRRLMRCVVAEEQAYRNRHGGYWIAESKPDAARQALTRRWPASEVDALILATDGFTSALSIYGLFRDWTSVLQATEQQSPSLLLDTVHEIENTDRDGRRWPRSKRHDDKTLAVIRFEPPPDRHTLLYEVSVE